MPKTVAVWPPDLEVGVGILDGRVAIVTGGGRGIGRSHCLELAAQGATVVVNDVGADVHGDRETESPAHQVVAEIEGLGGKALANGASVTDWDAVAAMVADTVSAFGRLDAVVNNAGIVRDRMITSLGEADFDAVMAVHVKGTFTVTKHASDHWRGLAKAGGDVSGRIINTTSGAGLMGNVGQAAYGSAKAAIAGLTMVTAMEMERYGVTANAISPIAYTRMVATMPSMADYQPDPDWDRLDPGNSSPVVAWLASAAGGWLTGQVLRIDGNTVQRMRPWALDDKAYTSRHGQRLDAGEIGTAMKLLYGVLPAGIPGTHPISGYAMTGAVATWSEMLAGRDPGAPALIAGDVVWSSAELLARARGAARWLDHIGVPAGSPVPALLGTTLRAFALTVGGAGSSRPIAPLGPRLTVRELAGCVNALTSSVLVTEREYLEDRAQGGGAHRRRVVAVEDFSTVRQGFPERTRSPIRPPPSCTRQGPPVGPRRCPVRRKTAWRCGFGPTPPSWSSAQAPSIPRRPHTITSPVWACSRWHSARERPSSASPGSRSMGGVDSASSE